MCSHVGTTFLHYIERNIKVSRFDKEFEGKLKFKNKLKIKTKIFVAYKSDKNPFPEKFSKMTQKIKIIKSIKLGWSNIDIMSSKVYGCHNKIKIIII